jgi:hypothetical protein
MTGKAFLLLLARLLMSSLFVWDGTAQLRNPGGVAQYFASVHIPAPNIAVRISIPVHLLGGLALLDRADLAEIALAEVGTLAQPPAAAQEVVPAEAPKSKPKPVPPYKAQERPLSGTVMKPRRQPIQIVLEAMWKAEARGDVDEAVKLAACALPYTSPRLQAVQVRQANSLEDMPLDQLQALVKAGKMALQDPDYLAAMQRQAKLDADEQAPMTVEAAVTDVAAAVVLDESPETVEADSQS